jgi:hypothetical protein
VSCLKDGETEGGEDTTDPKQIKEEMENTQDLKTGDKVVPCPKDREEKMYINIIDFKEKKKGKEVIIQHKHWQTEDISKEERFLHGNWTPKNSNKYIKPNELILALAKKPG